MPKQATSASSQEEKLALAERWLRRALAFVSTGFILLFLYTSLRRMAYPFSFDQIEGGMVTSVWRLAHGLPLYTKPTTDFVPYLYSPLYFYLAAALSKVLGAGYAALRLVSILATLGSLGVIYALIHRETRSRLAAIAGAGLYAACYLPLQGWLDIGRVDSLFIFLLLLAIYCTRRAPILIAVLIWLVAFQTKQTILPVAVLVLCADWQRPGRLALGLVTLLAGLGATIAVMNHTTGGWYSYYLFGTAKGLPWVARTLVLYIPSDLLAPLGLAFLILLASLLCQPPSLRGRGTQFYLVVSFAIYASIWYLLAGAALAQHRRLLLAAFACALAASWVAEFPVLLRVNRGRSQNLYAMQHAHLDRLHGAGLAQDVGFIGYFSGAPICDLSGLVNGRAVAQMTGPQRIHACLAAKPSFLFVTANQIQGLDTIEQINIGTDWFDCGSVDFTNVGGTDNHRLLIRRTEYPNGCPAHL